MKNKVYKKDDVIFAALATALTGKKHKASAVRHGFITKKMIKTQPTFDIYEK